MQEDEDGNALTTVKPDVAAVLRAKRDIQPGEFIRYQYTDQSENLKKILHQEITLVYICRIRIRLYVIKSLNDIYMSNNF